MKVVIMTEFEIWQFLLDAGVNPVWISAIMGNIMAESAMKSNNMQNSYEKRIGFTDETYTRAVDNGLYKNFENDGIGYGFCQWTYKTRKAELLKMAKNSGVSVGDAEFQLRFMLLELERDYNSMYKMMIDKVIRPSNVNYYTEMFMKKYENPADQSANAVKIRCDYAQKFFEKHYGNSENSPNIQDIVNKGSAEICIGGCFYKVTVEKLK